MPFDMATKTVAILPYVPGLDVNPDAASAGRWGSRGLYARTEDLPPPFFVASFLCDISVPDLISESDHSKFDAGPGVLKPCHTNCSTKYCN